VQSIAQPVSHFAPAKISAQSTRLAPVTKTAARGTDQRASLARRNACSISKGAVLVLRAMTTLQVVMPRSVAQCD
jgi:hypothetical protein